MKILLAACALAVSLSPLAASAQETQTVNASSTEAAGTPATTTPAVAAVLGTATASPALIVDIDRAKGALSQVTLNANITAVYKTTGKGKAAKKKITGYQVASKDVAVAVLNPATDEIFVVRGTQRGKAMSFSDPKVSVQLASFNGVNSRFRVTAPDGGFVIAIRYLIAPDTGSTKQAITGKMRHATYVPYSPALQQPEVIAYGERYLRSVIDRATYELQLYPSVSDPGKTVPEAVKPALIRALVLAEHTNGGELAAADERTDVEQVIGRVHVLFAGNGPDTYRYSGSSAGALGISQFIASTYRGLVDRHPRANLEPDFVRGMENHVNSIKATYLLIDDYIAAVHSRAKNGFSSGSAFDYGAAAYNGGVVRVARAVNAFGQNWNQDRGDQLSAVKAQISGTQSEVNSLASQVKKTKDKKAKAQLQSQLNDARARLAAAKDQLSKLEDATLRAETQGYLQKIYKVISVLNSSHEPVQS